MISTFLTILVINCLAINLAGGCSFFFPEVCKDVKCPNGKECFSDMSHYCDDRFGGICPPIALCSKDVDPCQDHMCPEGFTCVKVKDVCDGDLCTLKAQCNVRNRSGICPDPKTLQIHSCMNECEDSDQMCPVNTKCCYSSVVQGQFCVNAGTNVTATGEVPANVGVNGKLVVQQQ